jgi:Protein of unknown function (DUF2750)
MEAEASPERIQAVLQLPAARRYTYFIQRVVASGEAWGLDGEGWALALDDDGGDVLPLWPGAEFAALCARRLWEGFTPKSLGLEELMESVLPQLDAEGLSLGVFFTPQGQGYPVTAAQLLKDLRAARGLPA